MIKNNLNYYLTNMALYDEDMERELPGKQAKTETPQHKNHQLGKNQNEEYTYLKVFYI